MLFLLLKLRIETTTEDLVLNLNNEWIKKQKRWKYLKIRGKILKLCRSLIFKIFLIDFEKSEVKPGWLILLSKGTKRDE